MNINIYYKKEYVHNFLMGKFANILNTNSNNLKIANKANNNSIKTINNYDVYNLICSCNKLYIEKTNRSLEFQFKEHI